MKTLTQKAIVLVLLISNTIFAQESFEDRAKKIAKTIEEITKSEKTILKTKVEEINVQLEKNTITKEVADHQKLALATTTATTIETKIAAEQTKLDQLVQDQVNGKIESNNRQISIKINKSKDTTGFKIPRRNTSQFVFAAGINNVVTNGEINQSDYRYWGSHFYEWGLTRNQRILKNDNLLHFKYGFSVMYNNLRPTNNRVFQPMGNQTVLVNYPIELDDSRLKNVALVIPMHIEFDFSRPTTYKNNTYYPSHKSVRIGLGGYLGTRLKTKQYIQTDVADYKSETITKGGFNTENFIYGLSGYIGYKETSLYVKYDLNSIFKNNIVNQNNVSLGVRFDFN